MMGREVGSLPALVVLAKHPTPGRSKTRLCPPCLPEQAAAIAHAALLATLAACASVPAARHVLALEGPPETWTGCGFDVLPQRGDGLGERIDAALADAGWPAVLMGMDTPQVAAAEIEAAGRSLMAPGVDAILGPCPDGGYWIIGLRHRCRGAFAGVPMSAANTFDCQLRRLRELGLHVEVVGTHRDVDEWSDALEMAAVAPWSTFGHQVRQVADALARAGVSRR